MFGDGEQTPDYLYVGTGRALLAAPEGEVQRSVLEVALAAGELGWHPENALDRGLGLTLG